MTKHPYVFVMICWAQVALAHPIVIHTGTLVWHPQGLDLALELDGHTLEHELLATPDVLSPQATAEALARSLCVMSHEGTTYPALQVVATDNGRYVRAHFEVPTHISAIAVTHRPHHALGTIARQFQLAWTPTDTGPTRMLQLTSGGNHAVLLAPTGMDETSAPSATADEGLPMRPGTPKAETAMRSCRPGNDERFTKPFIRIGRPQGDGATFLNIDYPCTLLLTWDDLLHSSGGLMAPASFESDRDRIAAWATRHLSSQDRLSPAAYISSDHVHLLNPAGETIPTSDPRRYSIYTTRVRICVPLGPGQTTIRWTGFNAAILAIPVVYENGGTTTITRARPTIVQDPATVLHGTRPKDRPVQAAHHDLSLLSGLDLSDKTWHAERRMWVVTGLIQLGDALGPLDGTS